MNTDISGFNINLAERPPMEEFWEETRILAAIQHDEIDHKKLFRGKLEDTEFKKAGGDWDRLLYNLDKHYKALIAKVKTQDAYNKLFKNLVDVGCIAFVISGDMHCYCEILAAHIERIIFSDCVCPCCGKEFDLDVVDRLQADSDKHKNLEWFYGEFYKRRRKDMDRMKKVARENQLDVHSWQAGVQGFGSRGRVEELEGKSLQVIETIRDLRAKQEKEIKRSAVELALKRNAERRAAGFKFYGEE